MLLAVVTSLAYPQEQDIILYNVICVTKGAISSHQPTILLMLVGESVLW